MSPPQPIPNSSRPEGASGRDRSDAAEPIVTLLTPLTALPPRRVAADPADSPAAAAERVGLRIEPQVQRVELSGPPSRIDVQEINSGVTRLDQATPAPQKVPRQVKFHELPTREEGEVSSSEEGARWGIEKQRSGSWMLGAGIIVSGIIILCLILLPFLNSSIEQPEEPAPVQLVSSKPTAHEFNPLEGQSAAALKIFLSYATATKLEEAQLYLRDREALTDLLQKDWRPMGVPEDWQPAEKCSWLLSPPDSPPHAILVGTLPNQSEFTAHFIHDGKKLRLDWKATTAYSTASFTDLAKNQGDPSEVRGTLAVSDYYNFTWPEKDFQSYKLVSPDRDTTLWCYARREDPTDVKINQILLITEDGGAPTKSRRVTLKLASGPAEKLPNQWLIQELLHPDWSQP